MSQLRMRNHRRTWTLLLMVVLAALADVGCERETVYAMYIAKHRLDRGEKISADDFLRLNLRFSDFPDEEEGELLRSKPDLVNQLDFEDYLGRRLARAIDKGAPLVKSAFVAVGGPTLGTSEADDVRRRPQRVSEHLRIVTSETAWYVDGPYPVRESGVRVQYMTSVFWMDNRRVIFVGFAHKRSPNDEGPEKPGIYIWDTKTGELTEYRWPIRGGLCYSNGYINYSLRWDRAADTVYLMEGPLGNERSVAWNPKRDRGRTFPDRINCKRDTYLRYDADEPKRSILPLKSGEGYVDFGLAHASKPTNAYYYSGVGAKPVELPFNRESVSWSLAEYFRFKGAYLLWDHVLPDNIRRPWNATDCLPAWWLNSDGTTEELCIPSGPWSRRFASVLVEPTKRGFFIVSHGFSPDGAPGVAGGYLVAQGGRARKVISGYVETASVSPNGCRLAFSHATKSIPVALRTLKVVDVCGV